MTSVLKHFKMTINFFVYQNNTEERTQKSADKKVIVQYFLLSNKAFGT